MTARPTGYATWAASGATNLAQPDGAHQNVGWGVGEAPPSSYFNYLQQQYDQWIRYLDAQRGGAIFGDGSDGAVVFDGVATGASMGLGALATGPSGGAYRLVRDLFATTVGVATGIELQTAGFRVFATDQFTATGLARVTSNGMTGATGNGASGGLGGLPAPAGTVGGGATGGRGSNIGGTPATGGTATGYGGAGGGGGSETNGGVVTAPPANAGSPRGPIGGQFFGSIAGAGLAAPYWYQAGGGGGGGDAGASTGVGGGGGGGGGVLAISARNLYCATSINLQTRGGAGGAGSALGPNSGGGGGGGGLVLLAYGAKSAGASFPAVECCPGGIGGAGITATGKTGAVGTVIELAIR